MSTTNRVPYTALSNMMSAATNPKDTGAGTWGLLHQLALEADSEPEVLPILKYMIEFVATKYKASECRSHFQDYIKANSLKSGKAFEWTVGAHNDVNKRTGKYVISVSDARAIWDDANVRIVPCSDDHTSSTPVDYGQDVGSTLTQSSALYGQNSPLVQQPPQPFSLTQYTQQDQPIAFGFSAIHGAMTRIFPSN